MFARVLSCRSSFISYYLFVRGLWPLNPPILNLTSTRDTTHLLGYRAVLVARRGQVDERRLSKAIIFATALIVL